MFGLKAGERTQYMDINKIKTPMWKNIELKYVYGACKWTGTCVCDD